MISILDRQRLEHSIRQLILAEVAAAKLTVIPASLPEATAQAEKLRAFRQGRLVQLLDSLQLKGTK
jgi:hypothetical protein